MNDNRTKLIACAYQLSTQQDSLNRYTEKKLSIGAWKMSKYNQEYYIPFVAMDDSKLFVGMDKKTVMRRGHRKLNLTEGPMFYLNSYKEEDKKEGVKLPIPNV
ncbi:MAG: hypothetical protein ACSHWR_07430, partial [Psychromonas sp.]